MSQLCYREGRCPINRDYAQISEFEKRVLDNFYTEEITNTDKLFMHVLKLCRREETSELTIQNVKKLNSAKQAQLFVLAYRLLNPFEWKIFKDKIVRLCGVETKWHQTVLKLPFGHIKEVQTKAKKALKAAI